MPIGVPKVPFRLPGEPSAQWVDLYNRLGVHAAASLAGGMHLNSTLPNVKHNAAFDHLTLQCRRRQSPLIHATVETPLIHGNLVASQLQITGNLVPAYTDTACSLARVSPCTPLGSQGEHQAPLADTHAANDVSDTKT